MNKSRRAISIKAAAGRSAQGGSEFDASVENEHVGASPQRDEYLHELGKRRNDPGFVIRSDPLAGAMESHGAKALSAPDIFEPFQSTLGLYIGVTTPGAKTEMPHWHTLDQTEAYHVVEGELTVLSKHRWDDAGWVEHVARRGDVVVLQPEVCHWVRWTSGSGLAMVYKAPQRAGVGRFPAGKVVCQFCPHFQRGCQLPEGFAPLSTAA